MPFWNTRDVGLSVGPAQMAMVDAKRRGVGVEVTRYATASVEGLLRASPMEQNITDPAQWCTHLRALLGHFPAAQRITLALPDAVVRVLLLNLQQVPKSRTDFEALIRWHMEKIFLHPLGAARFSYQVLPHPKTGWKVVATAVRQEVIAQYETLCENHEIIHIAPVSFSLYNLFEPLIASHHAPHAVFTYLSDRSLTVLIFEEGILNFIRVKEFPEAEGGGWVDPLIREMSTSLSFYEGIGNPSLRPTHLFLFRVSAHPDPLLMTQLEEALHLTPVLLDARRVIRMTAGPQTPMTDGIISAAAAAVAGQ